jgi:hypothetical protein
LDLIFGAYHTVTHPIQTVKGLYHVTTHPIQTAKALGNAVYDRASAIWSGDTHALGQTFTDIASILLVPEGKAAEVTKAAELVEVGSVLKTATVAEGVKSINIVQSGTGLNNRLIPPYELITRKIVVPTSGRGVTPALRADLKAVAARGGETGAIDAAHVTPHVFSKPGDTVLVRPQARSINRGEGRDIARAAAARRVLNDPRVPVRPKK